MNDSKPLHLSVMNLQEGVVFIMESRPWLSWKAPNDSAWRRQSAYRLCAASRLDLLEQGQPDLWDSGKVMSEQSLYIPWGGQPLASRARVFWNVTLWNQDGLESAVSDSAQFEIALLTNSEWKGKWISYPSPYAAKKSPVPCFRKAFHCGKAIHQARLYASARGIYEARINGKKVGDELFAAGWTDYHKQLQYITTDVSALLDGRDNVLSAMVAPGWYSGNLAWMGKGGTYGNEPEFLAQLEITYEDGTQDIIVTDGSWTMMPGPLVSDLYNGETYDEFEEQTGWDLPGFDDSAWQKAHTGEKASELATPLVSKVCQPVRKIMEKKAVRRLHPKQGVTIWDFGQNMTGWVRFRFIKGMAPQKMTLRFAEMLYPDGSMYTQNYRTAESTDRFIFRPGTPRRSEISYEPHFTFHGFRYCEIEGFQHGGIDEEDLDVTAVVIHSDLPVTGSFECGIPKLNQLYSNICWGQRGNFLEIPTDCPQRDERLGWTGDAEVFCGTAAFNMNVSAFFRKWLRDQREAQLASGSGAHVCPNVIGAQGGSPAWADAIVIIPWTMYQRYGDLSFLTENYDSMVKWVEFMKTEATNLIRPESGFGDWLAPDSIETPKSLIGTAYFATCARLLSQSAEILNNPVDKQTYSRLAEDVASAFRRQFLDDKGMLKTQNQTSCILALYFNLLLPEQRPAHIALLEKLIRDNGTRLSTGFVGTASLMLCLTAIGHTSTAYDLLLQEEYPSWLYSINQGATTMWERWNSYSHKDGFGSVNMNSFNHYAYGAVGQWMAATVAGLSYNAPGGKELLFAAIPDERIGYAKASLETPYGLASSSWAFDGATMDWVVSAPPNTTMRIVNPFPGFQATVNGQPLAGSITLPSGEAVIRICK